jgi:multisubunit Na+/H+ antiporter MnhF subunit
MVMVLALLAQAFQRSSLFELPVLLALLMFGGGMVFVRAMERWL